MSDEVLDLMHWDEPEDDVNRLSYLSVGAGIEVHKVLGPGFLESVYRKALLAELRLRGLRCETEVRVPVLYKGENVGEGRIDILVEQKLIIEVKTVESFAPVHTAQLISYLKATGLTLGLLINFHVTTLSKGVKRVVFSS